METLVWENLADEAATLLVLQIRGTVVYGVVQTLVSLELLSSIVQTSVHCVWGKLGYKAWNVDK